MMTSRNLLSRTAFAPAACLLFFSLLVTRSASADETNVTAEANKETASLLDTPLQELMRKVTIAKRTPEPLEKTAAGVSVLTQDDIRRSGATSIPEALRYVPGLDVARVDAHTWAISSRGFNDVFANKLLVMIDGRTVYSPLFSGVFWDEEDTLMEDIDRIEVVRGPGATLWGANAVNGVINVVTKSAKDSQGLLVSGGAGTEERGFANVRYGFKLDDGIYMKAYAKYFNRDSSVFPNGSDSFDSWNMARGGFRIDVDKTNNNILTLQGDAYSGQEEEIYFMPNATPPAFVTHARSIDNVSGANGLGRWTHDFGNDSQFILQTYYDRTVRNNPVLSQSRDTYDIDSQHVFKAGDRNEVTWGAGFRTTHRDVKNSLNVALVPPTDTRNLYSAFLQDEIDIVPGRFKGIIGSKFEHNDFTGFEVQPNVRAVFTPRTNHTIWASISRAVRTPSEAESDIRLNIAAPGIPPGAVTSFGNPNMLSESLLAYEIGYRFQPFARLSLDLTAFYNDYSRLRSLAPLPPVSPFLPPQVHPSIVGNGLNGEGYGGEAAVTFEAVPDVWRLKGGYSYLEVQIHRGTSPDQTTELTIEGSSPRHQFFLLSALDLPFNLEFDTTVRYVDRLRGPGIPSYVEVDAQLAWHPKTNLEFAIVGQNLLHEHHAEFAPTFIGSERTDVERGLYGKVTFRY
jgi:iron complex outermembrane receptor protein